MSQPGVQVLVVDDDEDLRAIITTRLRAAGFEVREAEDGKVALARLQERAADLLLLDVKMPGMSGFELQALLRDQTDPPHVIFLTAMGQLEDRLRGLYGGAVDYITKPFAAEELVARVVTAARRKRELAAARVAATIDQLTGLSNRRAFDEALREEVARARREGRCLALIYLDADGLKETNDRFGHDAGDELLKAISRALGKCGRVGDRAARIGGDEFALLLPGACGEDAEAFLARLRRMLEAEVVSIGERRAPTASFGVAVLPRDAHDEQGLRAAADRALYRNKGLRR